MFLYDTIVRLARALHDLSVKKRGLPALKDLDDKLFEVLNWASRIDPDSKRPFKSEEDQVTDGEFGPLPVYAARLIVKLPSVLTRHAVLAMKFRPEDYMIDSESHMGSAGCEEEGGGAVSDSRSKGKAYWWMIDGFMKALGRFRSTCCDEDWDGKTRHSRETLKLDYALTDRAIKFLKAPDYGTESQVAG